MKLYYVKLWKILFSSNLSLSLFFICKDCRKIHILHGILDGWKWILWLDRHGKQGMCILMTINSTYLKQNKAKQKQKQKFMKRQKFRKHNFCMPYCTWLNVTYNTHNWGVRGSGKRNTDCTTCTQSNLLGILLTVCGNMIHRKSSCRNFAHITIQNTEVHHRLQNNEIIVIHFSNLFVIKRIKTEHTQMKAVLCLYSKIHTVQ